MPDDLEFKCHIAQIEITYNDGRKESLRFLFKGTVQETITTSLHPIRTLGEDRPIVQETEESHVFTISGLLPRWRLKGV